MFVKWDFLWGMLIMDKTYLIASIGGVLIGLAAVGVLLGLGRIAGVSGIVNGIIDKTWRAEPWRFGFVLGLLGAGIALPWLLRQPAPVMPNLPYWQWALAGVLVGIGSRMGSGCTSGHGVCGLGRRSKRSLVAVLVFMSAAIVTVYIGRHR